MTAMTDPNQIRMMQILTLRSALKLEMKGLYHSSGVSALSRLKQMGIVTARTRAAALVQLNAYINEVME